MHTGIKLLAVGLRPFYLTWEFSVLLMWHPNTFLIINVDFYRVDISKTLTNFTQFVTCSTRGDKALDLLCVNVVLHNLIFPVSSPVLFPCEFTITEFA